MIEISNLSFSYKDGFKKAVNKVSFSIKKGEIFGFLGPNGAGKSTTQMILTGLLKGYEGTINIMGKDLKDWDSTYFEKIGVCFELPNHFLKLTGFENLNFFKELYSQETDDPIDLLHLVELKNDKDKRVSSYSKGMKMRLNFARSLLNKPEILFLDEPTTGLDPRSGRQIKDIILEKKKQGTTIFLTTHNMAVADELCDRVAFIVDGEIKLIESPHALKLSKGTHKVKVEYEDDEKSKITEFPLDCLGKNADFLHILRSKKIKTIHSQEPSMEDIFISETGRKLDE